MAAAQKKLRKRSEAQACKRVRKIIADDDEEDEEGDGDGNTMDIEGEESD